jgi:hypothetical protein
MDKSPTPRKPDPNKTIDDLNESQGSKSKRKKISDFEFINSLPNGKKGDLGRGAYGQVKLAREVTGTTLYAMKIVIRIR